MAGTLVRRAPAGVAPAKRASESVLGGSVLAEIEGAKEFFAERVFQETAVAFGAEVEAEALVKLGLEFFGSEALVALEDLRDCLHVIVIEVAVRDLGRVKPRIRFYFHDVAGIAGFGQILSAQITREVDHQRLILQWEIGWHVRWRSQLRL